jgi:hypothetical protein
LPVISIVYSTGIIVTHLCLVLQDSRHRNHTLPHCSLITHGLVHHHNPTFLWLLRHPMAIFHIRYARICFSFSQKHWFHL